MKKLLLPIVISTLLAVPSMVAAQTAAPAKPTTAAPAKPAAPTSAKPAGSADQQAKAVKSKECSAQADQKGLHGKARKKFREECKKM